MARRSCGSAVAGITHTSFPSWRKVNVTRDRREKTRRASETRLTPRPANADTRGAPDVFGTAANAHSGSRRKPRRARVRRSHRRGGDARAQLPRRRAARRFDGVRPPRSRLGPRREIRGLETRSKSAAIPQLARRMRAQGDRQIFSGIPEPSSTTSMRSRPPRCSETVTRVAAGRPRRSRRVP